jgi:hypothetical protein
MATNLFKLCGIGERFVDSRFEQFQNFQTLKSYFENRNMNFIYERAQIFVAVNSDDENGSAQASLPFCIGVVPTFKTFDFYNSPSHNAASIVGYVTENSAMFIGVEVTVKHSPLELASFTLVEIGQNGEIETNEILRSEINLKTPEEIANALGVPDIDISQWNLNLATTNIGDTSALASMAFNNIINDNYASSLYPDGGVQRLLNDNTLADKFSLAVRQRYSNAIGSIMVCTSTSTSCNGCTSSSSSSISL